MKFKYLYITILILSLISITDATLSSPSVTPDTTVYAGDAISVSWNGGGSPLHWALCSVDTVCQNEGSVVEQYGAGTKTSTVPGYVAGKWFVVYEYYSTANHYHWYVSSGTRPTPTNATFSSNVTSGVNATAVLFTDSSSGSPTAWNWSFQNVVGNNTQVWFSTTQNPTKVFGTGNYSIVLNASNTGASNISAQKTFINVSEVPAPIASFSSNVTSGVNATAVLFTDGSSGSPTAWNWSFQNIVGNNTQVWFSTTQNPTKVFGTGNYSIVLNASNTGGSNISSQKTFINVSEVPNPTANFTMSNTTGITPVIIKFTDTSLNSPTTWNWSFGNGNYSSSQNPTYIYNYSGNYTIILNVSNGISQNSITKYAQVNNTFGFNNSGFETGSFTNWESDGAESSVTSTQHHTGSYSATLTGSGGYFQQEVNLTDSENITFWAKSATGNFSVWVGSSQNLYTAVPNVWTQYSIDTYPFIGITLIMISDDYDGIPSYFDDFNVTMSGPQPISNWTPVQTIYSTPPTIINFLDQSTHSPTSWNWSFGDGTYSSLQNPTHIYNSTGYYTVILNAINANGTGTRTRTEQIRISDTLYYGYSNQGIVVSEDGINWVQSGLPVNYTPPDPLVKQGIIYIGDQIIIADNTYWNNDLSQYNISIARSPNIGQSWFTIFDAGTSDPIPPHFRFAYLGNGEVIGGATTYGRIYKSTDYGETWTLKQTIGNEGEAGTIQSFITISNSQTLIFILNSTTGMGLDVYRSSDNFNTNINYITTLSAEWSSSTVSDSIYLGNSTIILSYDNNKVFRSTNNGLTWTNTSETEFYNSTGIAYFANLGNGTIIGVSAPDGPAASSTTYVYSSTDYGQSWSLLSDDISNELIKDVLYIGDETILMTGTGIAGTIFQSTDGGLTWTPISTDSPGDLNDYTGLINFTYTPVSGNPPLTVYFNDTSTSNPTAWNWSFGEGVYSESQNTTWTYTSIGNYTVNFTVWDSNGMFMKDGYVNVTDLPPPTPTPTPTPSTGDRIASKLNDIQSIIIIGIGVVVAASLITLAASILLGSKE